MANDTHSMTAVRFYEYGGPEVLKVEQHAIPSPAAHEVLIRVRAASVTWWDLILRQGKVKAPPGAKSFYLPFQLGREAAGEIAAVGANVTKFSIGARVVLMSNPACGQCTFCCRGLDNLCINTELPGHQAFGGYAQYVLAPDHGVLPAPDNLTYEKLACCLWSYGTVIHMVDARAKLRPGESVLITGASGGMGTAGLQLAKLAGASPIIALTGSPSKTEALLRAGADVVLNYHDEDIQAQIRRHTDMGLGPDVVLDMVGGPMLTLAIQVARLGARIVMAASMGGTTIELDIITAFAKHLDLLGTRASTREEQARVLKLAAAGKIDPVVSETLPLSEAMSAHQKLEKGVHVGKIVLLP